MEYLFIDFSGNLIDDKENRNNDFYSLSLEKQYQHILKRIPKEQQKNDFREFIETCFPAGFEKKYYLSCPNIDREKVQSKDGKTTFINNVVIRPEKTKMMEDVLPNNQNIILIGDICEGEKLKRFLVKGIQLIDDAMSSPYDITINGCKAVLCFEKKIWNIRNVDYNDTYFTEDHILEIVENCYTVENPTEIKRTYGKWEEYFNFRRYYLEEQKKRSFKLDDCDLLDSFAVNRKEYKKNSLQYDDYILDDHEGFKQGDMIVLSQKILEAESFPLIRINIIRNKKNFEADSIQKGKNKVNKEEIKIHSLARDNVIITQLDPKNQENKLISMINQGYELGERFKTIRFDIEPADRLNEIDEETENKIKEASDSIRLKYEQIKDREIKEYIDEERKNGEKILEGECEKFEEELNSNLKQDIKSNSDQSILNFIKEEKNRITKSIKKGKDESRKEYEERLYVALNKIDITNLYIERNKEKLKDFRSKKESDLKERLISKEKDKREEFSNRYSQDISVETNQRKEEIKKQSEEEKKKIKEEETKICFSIYFKLNATKESGEKNSEKISKCSYIVYDYRAEEGKLRRQENALKSFYKGNVKNPYLSTYLFSPNKLKSLNLDDNDKKWYLQSLNERQKEAVNRAVASNGLFLLQGPPGTGKTQVIAETVAHLVKQGKKVLISSETHKAIDNVFERLPKIAEIVPIRLIANSTKKNSEYTPKNLVDNFYKNISFNLKQIVSQYKNFKKHKEDFIEQLEKLKILNEKIKKEQSKLKNDTVEIEKLKKEAENIKKEKYELKTKEDDLDESKDNLRRTRRHIENLNLSLKEEDIIAEKIANFSSNLNTMFDKSIFKVDDVQGLAQSIINSKNSDIELELSSINPMTQQLKLKQEIDEMKNKMDEIIDEDDDFQNNEEYKKLRKVWKQKKEELKKQTGNFDSSDGLLTKIFTYDFLNKNLANALSIIEKKKEEIKTNQGIFTKEIEKEIDEKEEEKNEIENKINSLEDRLKNINYQINEKEDSDEIKNFNEDKKILEEKINRFFKDFRILTPYKNIKEALDILDEKYKDLEKNYESHESENREKIPMYEKISRYLSFNNIVEQDRKIYTKSLFENANVYGATCTSSERFTSANNSELGDFNLDKIDLKSVGIDVVIIDEVSKSSFIDLLIPILYGKTVILVGDHRQLPPMYEFSKMRKEDFEGLDEDIINPAKNHEFTKLYEECFFKTLFEKIPDDYKTMLVQQYRCHEHIMNVFNHFYHKELKLGFEGQNNIKNHNITLLSNGRKIIQPDYHTYFIDCKEYETRDSESTSIYNKGEAKVVVELLKKLKNYFANLPDEERLSVGVICTYGDQARKIKELMKTERIKPEDFKNEEDQKLIVSTVDDFQGDERDIIIISLVRNPQDPYKSDPGFITAYQRINVALSRARKLMILVGNRKYIEQKGVIDLPDVHGKSGQTKKNFRVYEEILNTIETDGRVLDDSDVIEKKEVHLNA